jgi:predicted  nucleic acid-binding Zn-ribbon protein
MEKEPDKSPFEDVLRAMDAEEAAIRKRLKEIAVAYESVQKAICALQGNCPEAVQHER